MKYLFLIVTVCGIMRLSAQEAQDELTNYMRSSLYTIILDDHGLMDENKAEIIKSTFFETPLPEKFNDHNLPNELRTFDPTRYEVTDAELSALTGETKKKKGGFGKALGQLSKEVAGQATAGLVDATDMSKLPAIFMKYFDENNIPNLMVAKWYNVKDEYAAAPVSSYFDMELIKKRGLYNASEFDKSIAEKSARGVNMLADAGENLINNTFIVGIRFNYVDKKELAGQLASTTSAVTRLIGGKAAAITDAAVSVGSSVAGRGYVIKATAFLYQLDWSEEPSHLFYTKYYNADDLTEFYQSEDFKVKYIGSETEWADIQSTAFSTLPEDELVKRAAVRSIDEVIAKLQKKFEVFRTKTPILTTEPEITAQIGLKEGLEGGDKYEVLEKIQDPETNITTYNRVAVIKVDKNKIWDNRYAADVEAAENAEHGQGEVQTITATSFTGKANNIYPGMLIRQID